MNSLPMSMQHRKVIIGEAAESDTVGVCRMDVRLRYFIHRLTVTYYFVLYLYQLIFATIHRVGQKLRPHTHEHNFVKSESI